MKKFLAAGLFTALFLASNLDIQAAGTKKKNYSFRASYLSKKGYWVLQQSPENDNKVVVYFYNNQHDLVAKETRLAKSADIKKKKVLRSLKRSLENALDWAEPI